MRTKQQFYYRTNEEIYRMGYIYAIKNEKDEIIYIGMTNNYERRMSEHRSFGLLYKYSHRPNNNYSVIIGAYPDITKSRLMDMEGYFIRLYKPRENYQLPKNYSKPLKKYTKRIIFKIKNQ